MIKLDLNNQELINNKNWIELAVAYSRLVVDDNSLLNGIDIDTNYSLANTYSAKYWLPMRVGGYPKIKLTCQDNYSYQINRKKIEVRKETKQILLFNEDNEK